MVTTIDPVVHGGRNRRYAAVVALHVFGATVAAAAFGAALGGAGALLGAPWRTWGPLLVVLVAVIYALREAAHLPIPIPDRRRQVPEWWRTFYSPPVASLLYGVGLGIGFLTFLGFGTFVAVSAVAIASGSPAVGALVCGPFGMARGLSVLLAGRHGGAAAINDLERLGARRSPGIVNAAAMVLLGAAALWA